MEVRRGETGKAGVCCRVRACLRACVLVSGRCSGIYLSGIDDEAWSWVRVVTRQAAV